MTKETKTVYQMISEVSAEMAKEGISKSNKNTQQGYKFRGIDDVYNALAPIMSKVGLVVLPRVLVRECIERTTQKGFPLFYTTVDVEFDFVSSHDGSKHTVKTYGEAMDSADKSTNKAMSAAYKYACMQSFCIPTEGDNDADATTHEVAPKEVKQDVKITDEEKAYLADRTKCINDAMKNATSTKMLDTIWNGNQKDLVRIKELKKPTWDKLNDNYLVMREKIAATEDEIPKDFGNIMAG